MRTVILFALLTAALLAPASAGAAPFVIGEGHKPGLAVDPAGTAYIAWYGTEPNNNSLHFCRLARGASACAGQAVLATTGNSLSRPFVVVAGARVTVVQYRYGATGTEFNQVFLYVSTNGGDTFDTGTVVGYAPFDESVLGPDASLSVVTNAFSEGGVFQNVPLGGGTSGTARAVLDAGRPYNGTVALLPDGRPLAVFASGTSDAAFRRLQRLGRSLNDPGGWSAPVDIGYVDYPHLAGGPGRASSCLPGPRPADWSCGAGTGRRSCPGSPWPPAATTPSRILLQTPAAACRRSGRAARPTASIVVHAVSDDGVNWTSGTLALQTDDLEAQPRVAAAPDHVGLAVWESRGGRHDPDPRLRARSGRSGRRQPPVATPTPVAADPVPQFHKTVVVRPISGKVRVRLKGARRSPTSARSTTSRSARRSTSRRGGSSSPRSPRARRRSRRCSSTAAGSRSPSRPRSPSSSSTSLWRRAEKRGARAAAAAAKPKSRKLWGDGKGKFRTRGQYGAATIRGTKWLVQDSCAGTLVQVTSGSVLVRDNVKKKNVIVRKGKRYTARPRR